MKPSSFIKRLIIAVGLLFPLVAYAQAPVKQTLTTGIEAVHTGYGIKLLVAHEPDWDVKVNNVDEAVGIDLIHYPEKSEITIKKYTTQGLSAKETHDKEVAYLQVDMPGAVFWKKAESIKIGGSDAVSSTYKNPATLDVKRMVFFQNKGVTYEMDFMVKEADFPKVKDDFSYILQNVSFAEGQDAYLKDFVINAGFKSPSPKWDIATFQNGISLVIINAVENINDAAVNINTTDYPATSLEAAYDAHVRKLKEDNPGLTVISEKQKLTVSGIDAMSFTYQHPTKRVVNREIVFLYKGKAMRLNFSVMEQRFEQYKPQFLKILTENGLKLL